MDEELDDLLASLELGARRRLLELQLPRAVPVFISRAPEDDDLRKELSEHLHGLVHDKGLISSFSRPDRGDGTDENMNQIVARAIDDAEVVLLLVTPSFLASRACMDLDVPRIMARSEVGRAHVVPILAHACKLSGTPVAGMHMHPLDGGPNRIPCRPRCSLARGRAQGRFPCRVGAGAPSAAQVCPLCPCR